MHVNYNKPCQWPLWDRTFQLTQDDDSLIALSRFSCNSDVAQDGNDWFWLLTPGGSRHCKQADVTTKIFFFFLHLIFLTVSVLWKTYWEGKWLSQGRFICPNLINIDFKDSLCMTLLFWLLDFFSWLSGSHMVMGDCRAAPQLVRTRTKLHPGQAGKTLTRLIGSRHTFWMTRWTRL